MKIIVSLLLMIYTLFGIDIPLSEIEKYKSSITKAPVEKVANQEVEVEQVVNNIETNQVTNTKQTPLNIQKKQEMKNLFAYNYKQQNLIRYGDNFFKNKNEYTKLIVPTSSNYILNKGDVLFVNIYDAQKNDIFELLIDNNGNVNIPHLGLMQVGNIPFSEAKEKIKQALVKSIPGTQVIIDIKKYTSIQVIITGNVHTPGIYNLSSFSSVKDALILAGGVTSVGSYRDIAVIREGKEIYQFDLYKLLHTPKESKDIFLRNGDIVSVNFAKRQIVLDGKVKFPAIYELKKDETFTDLMAYSGGFNFDVTKKSIKVTRYDANKTPKTFILSKNNFYTMSPQDGDMVEVFNNFELKEKEYVFVYGKVLDKGTKYTYFDGMGIKDLFNMVTFRSEYYKDEKREPLHVSKDRIKIIKTTNNDQTMIVSYDDDIKLDPFDRVEFFDQFDINHIKKAKIIGEVYLPGEFNIDDKTTLKDMLRFAGGFKNSAYTHEFEIVRYEVNGSKRDTIIKKFDLQNALKDSFVIHDGDVIKIFKIPAWNESLEVEIKGEVRFPGVYSIARGDKLSDLIKRAGGYTKDAFLPGTIFSRESLREKENTRVKESMYKIKRQLAFSSSNGREAGMQERSIGDLQALISLLDKQVEEYVALGRLTVHLDQNITQLENSHYNITLEHNDKIVIPAKNETISVYGEVFSPNSFIYLPALDSDDYIKKAGGLTKRADDESIYLVYANGEATQLSYNSFWGGQEVPRGSAIVVPMKVNETSNLLLWKEVTQLVYQLAITTVSLNAVGAF